MNQYHMRDILALSPEELWALPKERHIVQFDDGEITTHTHATIISSYFCYPLREYTQVPILKRFHLGEDYLTGDLLLNRINDVIWSIHSHHNEEPNPEHLAKLAIEAHNEFFNDVTTRGGRYVATLSIIDVLEICDEPRIRAILDAVEPTHFSLEKKTYPALKKLIYDPTFLPHNPIMRSARSGTLKVGQLLQIIGPLGFRTDIDSTIKPLPITESLAEGVNTLYGALVESRSGTKALLFNKELLPDTEYFNRKTQLVAQYVQRLHYREDCGTPHLIDFPVTEESLPVLEGKYYLTQDGHLDWIRGKETHLIGTTIKMRSVLGCTHPDPSGICATCYGRLSFSVPYDTNIGHVSAVIVGDKITSSVLSTKHLDASSSVEKFHLPKKERQYLRYGDEEETLYLQERLKGARLTLTVNRDEVKNLANILMLPSLDEYPVNTASQITQILLVADYGNGEIKGDLLKVSLYNRNSSFSKALLEHVRQVMWAHDDDGNVVIDLTGFDISKPFLTLPFKHVNMYEVMRKIKAFLHSGTDSENKKLGGKYRTKKAQLNFLKNYTDPVEALHVFMLMLNEKLYVNLVHCEILLYAMMVKGGQPRDYRLSIPGIYGEFEKYNELVNNRSLSVTTAYEKQDRPFLSPAPFIYRDRPDHPYDCLLMGGQFDQ